MSQPSQPSEGPVTMPDGSTRDVAYRNCPNCGKRAEGEPYDIGSGPELSCSSCETCWGAEGQNLNPMDPMLALAKDPEARKAMGLDDDAILAFTACRECGKQIASKWDPETMTTQPVLNCASHQ